jgi:hypothetical protein
LLVLDSIFDYITITLFVFFDETNHSFLMEKMTSALVAADSLSSSGVGSLSCYECLDQVGEGTYGFVYKAKCMRTQQPVALKR